MSTPILCDVCDTPILLDHPAYVDRVDPESDVISAIHAECSEETPLPEPILVPERGLELRFRPYIPNNMVIAVLMLDKHLESREQAIRVDRLAPQWRVSAMSKMLTDDPDTLTPLVLIPSGETQTA